MEDDFISAILNCRDRGCNLNSVICYLQHCPKIDRCPDLLRFDRRLRLQVLQKRIQRTLPSQQLSMF
jgi:hypothetical protein